jgi:hypothetical protein
MIWNITLLCDLWRLKAVAGGGSSTIKFEVQKNVEAYFLCIINQPSGSSQISSK